MMCKPVIKLFIDLKQGRLSLADWRFDSAYSNVFVSNHEVNRRRARLTLRWVTVCVHRAC